MHVESDPAWLSSQGSPCILKLGVHVVLFLIFVPSMYTLIIFGAKSQILGVKNPLQRVNGNAGSALVIALEMIEAY